MDHVKITPHLHDAGFERGIRATFLGQAHIAGTGPEGKTCRECSLWFVMARPEKGAPPVPAPPRLFRQVRQDAARIETRPLQPTNPAQGKPPRAALSTGLPVFRSVGEPASREEA